VIQPDAHLPATQARPVAQAGAHTLGAPPLPPVDAPPVDAPPVLLTPPDAEPPVALAPPLPPAVSPPPLLMAEPPMATLPPDVAPPVSMALVPPTKAPPVAAVALPPLAGPTPPDAMPPTPPDGMPPPPEASAPPEAPTEAARTQSCCDGEHTYPRTQSALVRHVLPSSSSWSEARLQATPPRANPSPMRPITSVSALDVEPVRWCFKIVLECGNAIQCNRQLYFRCPSRD